MVTLADNLSKLLVALAGAKKLHWEDPQYLNIFKLRLTNLPDSCQIWARICIYIYANIPEKGEDESQRETNMVVQDWEEKIAEHLLLNACSFRGACINVE